jgi:predicted dehydrogenase
MNRRQFLTATATAVPVLADRVFVVVPNRKVKVGFLGTSHSHAAEKLRIAANYPYFELVGAFEKSHSVQSLHPGVNWISRAELFKDAEAVIVESAVGDHARDAMEALSAGKHVHVEKPPAATWREMQDLVRVAREKNLLLQVGYMWRHNPGFLKIFEAVKKGWLGDIYQIRAMMNNQLDPKRRNEWADFAGGAFFEQASHLVDAVVRLLGRPKSVTSILRSSKGDKLMDNNIVTFEFDNALAVITNATQQPNASAHRSFEVYGTKGTMILKPIEPPALTGDYGKGVAPIALPAYSRYIDEFNELALHVSRGNDFTTGDQELLVQEWLLRACGMW